MYKLRYTKKHHYILYGSLVAVLLLITIGTFAERQLFRPSVILTQSKPLIKHVQFDTAPMQLVQTRTFTLQIPKSWVPTPGVPATATSFSWSGTVGSDAARSLQVYLDETVSPTLAVNRLLPVEASGSTMVVLNTVSDNCINFTDKATESMPTGTAPAKWGGVSFICDMGNYERDVVAIGSTEGINTITLTGSTAGSHRVLMLYTDNSANPDYTTFIDAVKSFTLK